MKIERTKNATRNLVFGTLLKVYQILIPFVMRTAMIYLMGIQYLGLNSLFTSVLQMLNLAELGVGSAMVFSMYKPIAEDDKRTICALMRLYKIYYRVIGGVVLVLGLCLLPFIGKLIKGDVPPDINIYVLYLLNLSATVLTYWLFAYKNSILSAHQRIDVTSKIALITDTIKYVLQITVLAVFHNYYYYVIVILITQSATNIATAAAANKMYPQYSPKGTLTKEQIKSINCRIRDLFTSKIGSVIVHSADTIVISAFLGLSVLAVYQNYFYLITAVTGVVAIIFGSCMAGIGNSLIVESREKNFEDFKKFTFITAWIAGFCTVCFLCLFQPFMELWVGEENMVGFSVVICFCIYYFIMEINALLNMYKDAAGMWHEDRFRPLVTAMTNLIMNLIMVQFLGLYGIILSTILSTLAVGMPWLMHNLFTVIFEHNYLISYLKKLIMYTVVTIMSCMVTYFICTMLHMPLVMSIAVKFLICCIVPNIIFLLVYYRTKEFSQSVKLLDRMTKGKLKVLRSFIRRNEKNMKILDNKKLCSGCGACCNICPKQCISMDADKEGFLYPVIDNTKCIGCGKCRKICPVNNVYHGNSEGTAYACINLSDTVREQSSSGGVFTLLAEYIINNSGVVFGAAFDDNKSICHIMVDNKNDLSKLRGSKYIQSRIGNTYRQVKEQLINNQMVLFSGTPCQISGLKAFLGKEYENLYLQDLICHGVPSAKVWDTYLKYMEIKNSAKIINNNISFRNKANGWYKFSIAIPMDNKLYKCECRDDPFMKSFLNDICLRESCYCCHSKSLERQSDITLADFWGIDKIDMGMFDDNGTSLVFVNSEKGKRLFDEISDYMKIKEVDIHEAVKYNPSSKQSVRRPKVRNKFIKVINERNFEKTVNKCTKQGLGRRFKRRIKKLLMPSCTK